MPGYSRVLPCLILALAFLLPTAARAEWVGFRNDLTFPVVVRITRVATPAGPGQAGGDAAMGKPGTPPMGSGGLPGNAGGNISVAALLYPGDVKWEFMPDRKPRFYTVTDARPPRPLLIAVPDNPMLNRNTGDVLYAIQLVKAPGGQPPNAASKGNDPPGAPPVPMLVKVPNARKPN
jgi:hypothetical protein